MSREYDNNVDLLLIESRLSSIDPRLPKGVRKHIRRLKQEGKLTDAIIFKTNEEKKKRARSAREILEDYKKEDLRNLLFSNDQRIQANAAHRLTLVLNKTGETDNSERESDLFEVHKYWPEQSEDIQASEIPLINQLSQLAAEADETNL
jgi:hypothetical protein